MQFYWNNIFIRNANFPNFRTLKCSKLACMSSNGPFAYFCVSVASGSLTKTQGAQQIIPLCLCQGLFPLSPWQRDKDLNGLFLCRSVKVFLTAPTLTDGPQFNRLCRTGSFFLASQTFVPLTDGPLFYRLCRAELTLTDGLKFYRLCRTDNF